MKAGWIYALRSDHIPYVKIGLTRTTPFQRIKELNAHPNYGPLGPWQQLHLKKVRDTRAIETAIHRKLDAFRVTDISSVRELFEISPTRARQELDLIPDADLVAPLPVNKLRLRSDFIHFLAALFQYSGLENYRNLQEAWTFSLFPTTNGGPYFTLNIARYEVAYSIPLKDEPDVVHHAIVVDDMAKRDKDLKNWLKMHHGQIDNVPYPSNWGNAVIVSFQCSFDDSLGLFELSGFRRALIAYWYEALLRMQERGTRSLHAKNHDYNATSEIFHQMNEMRRFRTTKC